MIGLMQPKVRLAPAPVFVLSMGCWSYDILMKPNLSKKLQSGFSQTTQNYKIRITEILILRFRFKKNFARKIKKA